MRMQDLQPSVGADLDELRKHVNGRGWEASWPSSFSDLMLLRIARSFRVVERSFGNQGAGGQTEACSLSVATFIVLDLLLKHPAQENDACKEFSETGLSLAMQLYQLGLERELASRLIGICPARSADTLLQVIWRNATADAVAR